MVAPCRWILQGPAWRWLWREVASAHSRAREPDAAPPPRPSQFARVVPSENSTRLPARPLMRPRQQWGMSCPEKTPERRWRLLLCGARHGTSAEDWRFATTD